MCRTVQQACRTGRAGGILENEGLLTFPNIHRLYRFYTPAVRFYTWFYAGSTGSTCLPSKPDVAALGPKEWTHLLNELEHVDSRTITTNDPVKNIHVSCEAAG